MNPIHAITDRLGNKGTLALIAAFVIGVFVALDYLHLSEPSPKITLLQDAWQAYDRAALSRDAPSKPFNNAFDDLTKHIHRIDVLISRGPSFDQGAEKTFHTNLTNLRECQAWLETYRQFVPVTDPATPNETRDSARDHIDACTDAHPIDPRPPSRGINDE